MCKLQNGSGMFRRYQFCHQFNHQIEYAIHCQAFTYIYNGFPSYYSYNTLSFVRPKKSKTTYINDKITEGGKELYKRVKAANKNKPINIVPPQYLYSTDDTTEYILMVLMSDNRVTGVLWKHQVYKQKP